MEMVMLLLVSALAQLVSPAAVDHSHINLNHIIDKAMEYKEIVSMDLFVEDVEPLAKQGCKADFFCKVQDILRRHNKKVKVEKEEQLLRNLQSFINLKNMNCTEVLKTVPKSEVKKPITDLLVQLDYCCKHRNYHGGAE